MASSAMHFPYASRSMLVHLQVASHLSAFQHAILLSNRVVTNEL